jgi:hypothetical protein
MAGSDLRMGTAGAQELRIPIGSRGTALGGAIGADAVGTDAIFYNPAGVALTDGTEAMFSNLQYFADMDLNYFAVCKAIEDFGSIAISAKILSVGDIVKTTWDQSGPEGTGEMFNPTLAVIGMTYARILTDRVTFGITGNFISESIDKANAKGFAIDFGINYNTKWKSLKLGIVAKNIGPEMQFSGPGFNYDGSVASQNPSSPDKTFSAQSSSFEMPSWIQFGASMDFHKVDNNRFTGFGCFESNNFSKDMWKAGLEYAYNERYFLRAGYMLDDMQIDYIFGLTLGAGAMFNLGGTEVTFEYSWNETKYFNNTQYFTGKVHF